jgi:hypothetical protein
MIEKFTAGDMLDIITAVDKAIVAEHCSEGKEMEAEIKEGNGIP